jgi:hypothetical protein
MNILSKTFISVILFGMAFYDVQGQKKSAGRIYLEHFRTMEAYQLSVRVVGKIERRYQPVAGIEVSLFVNEVAETNLLGTVLTSDDGTGVYKLSQEQMKSAKEAGESTYFAVIEDHPTFKFKTRKVTNKEVEFKIDCLEKDSIKTVIANVWEKDSTGQKNPQEKVEIGFFVERPLSPLPIGGSSRTDEKGVASMVFPDDLPGDEEGNIKVLVRILESDDYGTVEVSENMVWGTPTLIVDSDTQRSLWASSANAPITLLIFINSLIVGVWGVIFYILYKVFQIRKIGA